jgi:proteasome lid subunit RPN8/RPN11
METIQFPITLINQILEQAQSSPTQEICGLITGRNDKPQQCYPIHNAATHPERHFLLDPQQQIDAMRIMRNQGETLYAIYHSHPDAPATPSAEDLALAAYPDTLYFIVSLNTTGTLQMRGFRFKNETLAPVDVAIT